MLIKRSATQNTAIAGYYNNINIEPSIEVINKIKLSAIDGLTFNLSISRNSGSSSSSVSIPNLGWRTAVYTNSSGNITRTTDISDLTRISLDASTNGKEHDSQSVTLYVN